LIRDRGHFVFLPVIFSFYTARDIGGLPPKKRNPALEE